MNPVENPQMPEPVVLLWAHILRASFAYPLSFRVGFFRYPVEKIQLLIQSKATSDDLS